MGAINYSLSKYYNNALQIFYQIIFHKIYQAIAVFIEKQSEEQYVVINNQCIRVIIINPLLNYAMRFFLISIKLCAVDSEQIEKTNLKLIQNEEQKQ